MAARGGLSFIYLTVALDALAIGVVVPVLPNLIGAVTTLGPPGIASAIGALATVFALTQFFAAPIIGALSDRFGRRPIMLASNASLGLDFVVMALAPNLVWLSVGRILSGVASGSGPAAFAYLADVTPAERRAGAFGMLFGAQAVGATLGPGLGGLLSELDLRAPFWAAASLSLLNTLYGVLVLPESLPKELRARINWRYANPLGAIFWLLRSNPRLVGMVAVAFLLSFASQGANSIIVLYTQYRYAWTPATVGVVLTVFGLASLAVQALLVTPTATRFGARATFLGGLSLTTFGLAIFGAARTPEAFLAGIPLLALGAICGPIMGGYFSSVVADNEQGRLQGAWSGVNAAMGVLAPGAFAFVFATSITMRGAYLPGLAFLLAAALLALAVAIGANAMKNSPPAPPTQ